MEDEVLPHHVPTYWLLGDYPMFIVQEITSN